MTGSRWKSAGKVRPDYRAVLLRQIKRAGLPDPVVEYRFDLNRKWRLDIAWPSRMLVVEVEGMAHRTRERFLADIEKYNALCGAGWMLLRVYTRWICTERRELDKAIGLVQSHFSICRELPIARHYRCYNVCLLAAHSLADQMRDRET